jgi:hypothetical protein
VRLVRLERRRDSESRGRVAIEDVYQLLLFHGTCVLELT